MRSSEIQHRLQAGQSPRQIAADLKISLRRVYQVRGVERPRARMSEARSTHIRQAVAAGMSLREAARRFGASRKTVARLTADAEKPESRPKSKIPARDVAHILSRHAAARSVGTIARECGMHHESVRAIIRRHAAGNIDPADVVMTAIASEMAARGMTAHGLAEMVPGADRAKVYEYLRGDESPTTRAASPMLAALGLRVVKGKSGPG